MPKKIYRYKIYLSVLNALGGSGTLDQITNKVIEHPAFLIKEEENADSDLLKNRIMGFLSRLETQHSGKLVERIGSKKWKITKNGEEYAY